MSTLEVIQSNLTKIMNLFPLDAFLLIGILVMVIAIIKTGRSTEQLKEKNARQRRRMEAAYGEDFSDLAHH